MGQYSTRQDTDLSALVISLRKELEQVRRSTSAPPVAPGTILAFGGTSDPDGYFICNGRVVSRTEYNNLYDIIGTFYGIGDGNKTFAIPLITANIGSVVVRWIIKY